MKGLPEATEFWQHLTQEEQSTVLSKQIQNALKTQDFKSVPLSQLLDESCRILGPDRLYDVNRATLPNLHCSWSVKQALNAGRHLARWGCSAVQYNNRLHIFGGRGNDSEPRNSFHVLDLETLEIAKMNTQNLPTKREGHSCIAYKDFLIVYGGCYGGDDDPTRFNDVWILDLRAKKWTFQKTTGEAPPGQDGHVAALVDEKMIIYGGNSERMLLGSVYALNLKSFVWEELDVEGDHPQARESMGLAVNKNTLYIFGGNVGNPGEPDRYTDDFFKLEIRGKKVKSKRIVPLGPGPCPRLSHSLTWLKQNCLVLFGGESSEKLLDDVWLYLILQNIWIELKPENPIAPRIAHVAAAFGGKLLIYGGMGNGRNQAVKSDISILTFTEESAGTRSRPKRTSNRTLPTKREMEDSKSITPESKPESSEDTCFACGHTSTSCNFLINHPELGHCRVLSYAHCQISIGIMQQLIAIYANPSLTMMRIADLLEGDVIHIAVQGKVQLRHGEIVKDLLGPQPIDFSFLPTGADDDTFYIRRDKIANWCPNPTRPASVVHIYSPNKTFPPDTVAMMMAGTTKENLIAPLLSLSSQALMVSRGDDGLAIALTRRLENNIPCFFVAYNPDMTPMFPNKAAFYPNVSEILRYTHFSLDQLQNSPTGTSIYLYVERITDESNMSIVNMYDETFSLFEDLAYASFKPPSRQQFFVQGQPVIPKYDEADVILNSEKRVVDKQFRGTYWSDTEGCTQVRVYHENKLVFITPKTYQWKRKRLREDPTIAVIELRDPRLMLHKTKVMKWEEVTIGIILRVLEESKKAS